MARRGPPSGCSRRWASSCSFDWRCAFSDGKLRDALTATLAFALRDPCTSHTRPCCTSTIWSPCSCSSRSRSPLQRRVLTDCWRPGRGAGAAVVSSLSRRDRPRDRGGVSSSGENEASLELRSARRARWCAARPCWRPTTLPASERCSRRTTPGRTRSSGTRGAALLPCSPPAIRRLAGPLGFRRFRGSSGFRRCSSWSRSARSRRAAPLAFSAPKGPSARRWCCTCSRST